jgi:cathepsin L
MEKAAQNILREHKLVIDNNNRQALGESNYIESLYKFSHLDKDEFLRRYGLALPRVNERKKRSVYFTDVSECKSLPAYKNWVEEGKMGRVRDQLDCGDCWLMVALSALESAVSIEYDTAPLQLSDQHSLECMWNVTGRNPCEGGNTESGWELSNWQGGIVAESDYSYWFDVPADAEAMKCRVARYGPIGVSFHTNGTGFARYKSGVFHDSEKVCNGTQSFDHAVLIVGYGSETSLTGENVDYWLVQNSWSEDWGEKGLVKFLRGENLCGIESYPSTVVVKPKSEKPLKPIYTPTQVLTSSTDIYRGSTYLKSLGNVKAYSTYESARINCLTFGMSLLKVDSPETRTELIKMANSFYSYSETKLFVNGESSLGCSAINNQNGSFVFTSENCASRIQSFCEFINSEREFY